VKIYYISERREKRNTAGAKAPADISAICKSLGYQEFMMPRFPSGKNKIYQKAWLFLEGTYNWVRLKNTIEDESVVIYQHPMYGNRLMEKMIPMIQRKKHAKFVAVIHDLESLRGGIVGVIQRSTKTNEIADNSLLKKFDAIICHNEHMRKYLIGQGFIPEKLFNLEIFDYLSKERRVQPENSETPSIAVAGNLAIGKCAYIYNIFEKGNNPGLTVHLYGINFQEDRANHNMIYHGSFKPEELPGKLEGRFGLVWDGNSVETCEGNTGEYLKFNNPHKTSLYLSSGMPVIVWSQAAISDFVKENGVGITVDSLVEIENKIRSISRDEYKDMCVRTDEVGKKLKNGFYFKKTLMNVLIDNKWSISE